MFGKKETQEPANSEIFVIYDTKVEAYSKPMYAPNQHDLLREISNMMSNAQQREGNRHYLNAEDFQVFRIGRYWDKTGSLLSHQPEHVANLHEIKAAALRKETSAFPPAGI